MKGRKEKQKRKIRIELTPLSAFAWGCGLFFLISWFFALGIMVGRGFIPDAAMDIAEIKTRIQRIQKTLGAQDKERYPVKRDAKEDKRLEFFQRLTEKKRESKKTLLKEDNRTVKNTWGRERNYTIQFASLREKDKAKELVNKLNAMGYGVYFYKVNIRGISYYRVRSKKMMTLPSARKLVSRIKARDSTLNPIVTRVETDDKKGH